MNQLKNTRNIILILFIAIVGCREKKSSEPVVEKPFSGPEINIVRLTDLKGKSIDMEQYLGKTVFINFWATWCGPCLREMPSIKNAMEILKDKNIEFLFSSDETVDQIEKFENVNHYNFNYVRMENPLELNITVLPTTFIFNSSGKLVYSDMGFKQWDDKRNIDLILEIANTK